MHLDADLADDEMAALYRACDVLVHPYRGEGFAMPVLEAMASGLPVIHTAGGPTDEFCPPQAGWRIRSQRQAMPGGRVDRFETVGEPWMLEPDADHLAELLREAADAGAEERARRGAAGPLGRPALRLGPRGGALRRARRRAGRPRPARRSPPSASSTARPPSWPRRPGAARTTSGPAAGLDAGPGRRAACTCSPTRRPTASPPSSRPRVMAAAAGIDLDACPDIAILREYAVPGRDAALHAAAELYVPLHDACAGHLRLAGAKAATPAELGIRLAARPATHAA